MERTDYPAIATSLPPSTCISIIRDRVKRVQSINSEIAEWILERRKLEEAYTQGLQRLVKKQSPGDGSEMGIFHGAWQRILGGTAALAASHQNLNDKLENDVERPLQDFLTSNREWATFKTMEGNLAGIAKSIDAAEEKVEKLKKKGKRAEPNRVAEATQGVQSTMADWDSQAPFVFEKLQAIDELRLTHLRECLIRMQTLEIDQANQLIQTTEGTVQALLDINTMDEIKMFAASKSDSRGARPRGRPSTGFSSISGPDDTMSFQSSGSAEKGHSGIGGNLKRLGTVLRGRSNRNSTILPYQISTTNEPARSNDRLGIGRTPVTSSFSPQDSSNNLPADSAPPVEPPDATYSSLRARSTASDVYQPQTTPTQVTHTPVTAEIGRQLSLTDDRQVEGAKDSEGFSIPPPPPKEHLDMWQNAEGERSSEPNNSQFKVEIRNDVIPEEENEADAAMSKVANTLRASQTVSKRNRGRRDVRNTIYGTPDTADSNFDQSQNETGEYPQGGSLAENIASTQEDIPVREDYAMTPANDVATPIARSEIENQTPVNTVLRSIPQSTFMSDTGSDTHSIRSAHSTAPHGIFGMKHPELQGPGLVASIIESVSAVIDSGTIVKAGVVGEIALSYNARENKTMKSQEIIHLRNSQNLEKVVPNPGIIAESHPNSGEYAVALSQLTRTAVAFKYQLQLHEDSLPTCAPIIVIPVWKFEDHQASLILNYKTNPLYSSRMGFADTAILKNISIIIGVEGTTAISCQSKPTGTFSRERSRILWKLPELSISSTSNGKMIARFATEGFATGSLAEIKWELESNQSGEINEGHQQTLGHGVGIEVLSLGDLSTSDKDPFADEAETTSGPKTTWREVTTTRKVISGKYIAK